MAWIFIPVACRGRAAGENRRFLFLTLIVGVVLLYAMLLIRHDNIVSRNDAPLTHAEPLVGSSRSTMNRGSDGILLTPVRSRTLFIYVPVLNELGGLQSLIDQAARGVEAHASDPSATPYTLNFFILDNTGCDIRRRDNSNHVIVDPLRSAQLSDDQGEPRYSALREELLHSEGLACDEVLAQLDRLAQQPPPLVSVSIIRVAHVTLSFAQSMNFMLRHARSHRQRLVLFAHSDVTIVDNRIFFTLFAFIETMSPSTAEAKKATPFCFAFTNYDALAVVDVRSTHHFVGDFDERLSYYGDTDYFLRCELAGLPVHHLPYNGQVEHRTRASIGNSVRYGQAVRRSVPSWRVYYETKWSEVYNLRTDYVNFTFAHLSWKIDDQDSRADDTEMGLRSTLQRCSALRRNVTALIDAFVASAKPPKKLLVRYVEWSQQDDVSGIRISSVRLYMLPPSAMDDWAEAVQWPNVAAAVCAHAVEVKQSLFRIP